MTAKVKEGIARSANAAECAGIRLEIALAPAGTNAPQRPFPHAVAGVPRTMPRAGTPFA